MELHERDCRCVDVDPSGRWLFSCGFDATINVINLESSSVVLRLNSHMDKAVFVKSHPFYPFLLSTSADCTARIFAPSTFIEK